MENVSTTNNLIEKTEQPGAVAESFPNLVPASAIAKKLNCTPRYVHVLHETNQIPGYVMGKRLIRFNPTAVFAALGIKAVGGQV